MCEGGSFRLSCQNLFSLTCWCVELLLDVMILEGNIDWNPNVYIYIYLYLQAKIPGVPVNIHPPDLLSL